MERGVGRNRWVFRGTKAASRVLLFPFFRLETRGAENLPKKSAYILLAKHQCWEDIPLLALSTPRPLYYIAKHELFENPMIGWFLTSLGGLPLNRRHPLKSRDSLRATINFLSQGEGVVVFPEGTYYPNEMGAGKVGALRLILSRLSLPAIPVGIRYFWPCRPGIAQPPGGSRRRTQVIVHFGRPLFREEEAPIGPFLDLIMKKIAILSGL